MSLDSNGVMQFFNVPWDMGYRNLRYFASKAERDAWFDARVNEVYPNADGETITVELGSPIRVNLPYRVNKGWDARHNANYCRFWNKEYPQGEWQYCFITDVVYSNAHACNIYMEIDAWVNNIERMHFGQMLIERENTDTVNDLPEPYSVKRQVYKLNKSLFNAGTPLVYFLIATSHYSADPPVRVDHACVIDGVEYDLYMWVSATFSQIQNEVDRYAENGTTDRIVGVFAIPQTLVSFEGNHSMSFKPPSSVTIDRGIGSYTPKNKKCLRYPYTYCVVSDFQKSSRVFKWEDGGGSLNFNFSGASGMAGILNLVPTFSQSTLNYIENMAINITIPMGFSASGWANWLAQNQANIKAQETATAIQAGVSIAGVGVATAVSGGALAPLALGAGLGIASNVASTYNSINTMEQQGKFAPNPSQLPDGAMMYLAIQGQLGFVAYNVYPSDSEMKALDDWFDRWGYQVNRVGKPNIHGSHYYIKTSGATVYGACPQRDRCLIMDALDRGVTFWTNDTFTY